MNMKQLIFVGAVIGFFSAGAGFFIGQKMHENLFVRVVANEPIEDKGQGGSTDQAHR